MKVAIIICDRYKSCAGGKCFRALENREGAFDIYDAEVPLEIAAYTSCGGCPGGNIEYSPEEMKKNGVEAIHLATGFLVGYPPCSHIEYFKKYIESRFDIPVVTGTHPIPQKYYLEHEKLKTWKGKEWKNLLAPALCDESLRKKYD